MNDEPRDSYDVVPYDAKAFAYTHPDVLATMATIHGLAPPPVESCRVLELGCANGANLVPMSYSLPGASLVGIDLSPVQVADGNAVIGELGVKNVDLRAASIMDVDESWGEFDYIICHGVYSWVPEPVQEKILDIGRTNLTKNGVYYISYNTYPGWHGRGMIRQMMLFHTPRDRPPMERVKAAREVLQFMIDSSPAPDNLYCNLLKQEASILNGCSDSYLLHEQLEEFNQPCLFFDFAQRAGRHGLQYLSESQFSHLGGLLSSKSREQLNAWGTDAVSREQYLDFLGGRTFRRTLLVRAEHEVQHNFTVDVFRRLLLSGRATPTSVTPNLDPTQQEVFETFDQSSITTNHPYTKIALRYLDQQRPGAVSFDQLWVEVTRQLEGSPFAPETMHSPEGREEMVLSLVRCFLTETLSMHVYQPPLVRVAGERPIAAPLARRTVASGQSATSLWHFNVRLDDFEQAVFMLLDGTRDRAALLSELRRQGAAKHLLARMKDEDRDKTEEYLPDALDSFLRWTARCGLLVG